MITKFVNKYIINYLFFLMFLYIIIKAITIFLYLKEHLTYYIKEIHNYNNNNNNIVNIIIIIIIIIIKKHLYYTL